MFNKTYDHLETAQCPVCKTLFGKRDPKAIFKAHCSDCRATYWWKPWAERPNAVLDRAAEKGRCGCGTCGR